MSVPFSLPAASPGEVGFSAPRLKRIGDGLNRAIDQGRLPGAVALVARRGKLVYFDSFGRRDPAQPGAMIRDAIFRIYSMTKPIVSLAIMMMADEGRLQLADNIAEYLPEFAAPKVAIERRDAAGRSTLDLIPADRPITVQDLLRHTSGVTYEHTATGALQQLYRDAGTSRRDQTNAELAARLATLPLAHHPGTHWRYGHSTDLLGRLLEVVSGQPLATLLAAMVLDPLGMADTGFSIAAGEAGRLAQPFANDPDTGAPIRLIAVDEPPHLQSGGGGLVSTAADYARFLALLAGGGVLDGTRLTSRKTVELMSADHLGIIPPDPAMLPAGYGFGLGFAVRRQSGLAPLAGSAGDYYWSGVGGTAFWIDPQEALFAILLTQAPGRREWSRMMFRNLVYQALVD